MAETPTLPLADVSEMASLHRVFRNALNDVPRLVGPASGDAERAELVGSYYDNVLKLLHVHHQSEDESLTPRLVARGTPDEVAEATRIAEQHVGVLEDLDAAEAKIATFRATPNVDNGATLAGSLAVLNASLVAHLDEEEERVMPIAAKYINVAEWGEMPAHGLMNFTGDKIWLILGLIREQMTDGQRANMDEHMPPPVADFWAQSGEQLFTEYVGALRI
ncbi:MAG TPA: hemerythrin domain-containing protein [Frankiaceae bacterium]|nr:hemerythrin domain-containing protein [Frankiaceae bacterium]